MSEENEKEVFFETTKRDLENNGFLIDSFDQNRPWGGFFVLKEEQVQKFLDIYFHDLYLAEIGETEKLSPKILIVAPAKRLSWQYHNRRIEIWKILKGKVQVIKSKTDKEEESLLLGPGEYVKMERGERHRLVGLKDWGIVAEIWQHTNTLQPSDENDIIRIQDDFGR